MAEDRAGAYNGRDGASQRSQRALDAEADERRADKGDVRNTMADAGGREAVIRGKMWRC